MVALVTDPAWQIDLIDQFKLIGQLETLEVPPAIMPVYMVGQATVQTITTAAPVWTSVFSGFLANPAANAVLADTGNLAAGTYDLLASATTAGFGTDGRVQFELRDAPNLNNVFMWQWAFEGGDGVSEVHAVELAENERFRFRNMNAQAAATICCSLSLRRRS